MRMKARKKILPILLAVVMVVTMLLPIMALAASEPNNFIFDVSEGNITINDAGNGKLTVTYGTPSTTTAAFPNTQNITITGTATGNYIEVSNSVTTNITMEDVNIDWSSGGCAFYINDNSIVNLTLKGNNFLISGDYHAGLRVTSTVTLTIGGTGALTSTGGLRGAGIGGGDRTDCGSITINSGTVTANGILKAGIDGGAGIGGGYNGDGGIITISGGTVTATAGSADALGLNGGAGIGGGYKGNGGCITINGGTVTANGGPTTGGRGGGAGIGGGYQGNGGTININGGIVRAQGYGEVISNKAYGSAGIGGGYNGGSGIITISGGTIIANGSVYSPGIGSGNDGIGGGEVYISGGSVKATGDSAPPIGGFNVTLENNSSAKTPVFLTTVTLDGVSAETAVSALTTDPSYSYGMKDAFTDTEGKLYLYLPENTKTTAAQTSVARYVGDITTAADHNATGTLKMSLAIYTLSYNANGGSGTMANDTATQGVAFTLPPNGFIAPDGKQFKEWAIGNATTGAKVAAGDSYTFTATTTVYAVWEEDTTLPTVSTVTPSGTGVSITTAALSVTFSEAMDTGTAGTVALDNGATVQNPQWSNGDKTVTYDLSGLAYGTDYSITVSGFNDAAGNTMTADSAHSFTTANPPDTTPPTVTGVTPDGAGVSITTAALSITFSEAMDTGTTPSGMVALYGGATVQNPQWSNGDKTVTYDLSGLTYGTTYFIIVYGFMDAAGNSMADEYRDTFRIANAPDTTLPTVTGVMPGGTGAPISGNIVVTFSEAMDTTVTGVVYLSNDSGATYGSALTGGNWSGGDTVYTIPYSGLSYSTAYTVKIEGFKDAAGNTMAADSTHSFTTANAPDTTLPAVTGVAPGGTDAPISGNIVVTFSEAMDTTVAGAVYLSDDGGATYGSALTGGNWSFVCTVYTIDYSGLSYSTAYTFKIEGFKDAAGNTMAADSAYSFTTCDEPLMPSVSPSTLTIDKGSAASLTIAFGQGGAAATGAAITVEDSGIASVSQTKVTTPGSVTVTGLATGTTDITVVFNDTASTTATVSVTVQAVAPIWPSGSSLTASGVTRTGATLTWTAAADIIAVTGYKLYQDGTELASVTGDVYSRTVTGLSPSTSYTFQVQAGNADGEWTTNGPAVTVHTQSSGSSGGGSSVTPSKPTYTADVKADNEADTTLPVTVNTDTGSAAVNVGAQQGNTISRGGNVTVTMPSIPGVSSYTLGIPVAYLSTPGGKGTLIFNTDTGSLTLPADMLSGIAGEGSKVELTIARGDKTVLSETTIAAIDDRPLIEISVTIDGKKTTWNNPGAPVKVSIPYTPTAAELANTESIVIWYIDGAGNSVCVPNGHYDMATGTVTFSTTHFSNYAVGFNKVSFNDVATGAWYYKPVNFIAARGITTGTGNGNFSPDANLTRGEFLVMLMKAYDMAPDENPTDNFADAGSTYCTGYLAAAKRLGISAGVGNNPGRMGEQHSQDATSLFAPEKEITRQEMFTLLYNALKVIGQIPQGDSGKTLSDFSDARQIDSWAKDAMTLLVDAGTIGGNSGKLSPTSTATRAEMAQVLYQLHIK